jgi:hypothetical protein
MTRKGQLAEVLSKALYADDIELYSIGYRNYQSILEISLSEFIKISENFQGIPASRIYFVKRNGNYLYQRCNQNKSLQFLSKLTK